MARKLKPLHLLFLNGGNVNGIETGSGKSNLGFEKRNKTKQQRQHGLLLYYVPTWIRRTAQVLRTELPAR